MENRNDSLDFLKFLCIISVVCIHTNPFWGFGNIGMIIKSICRVSVPLFFMCNGYLFYTKYNKNYYKKYWIKILKIFICWSLFYILLSLSLISLANILNSRSVLFGYKEYFNKFSIANIYYCQEVMPYHLWYLVALIISIPVMHLILKYKMLNKALIISLILNLVGIILCNFGFVSFEITRDAIFLGIFYCTLGMFINDKEKYIRTVLSKISNTTYSIVIIFLFAITILESIIYKNMFNTLGTYYFSTVPLGFMIFCIVILNKNIGKDTLINKVGKNSLGIYVVHVVFINVIDIVLYKFSIDKITNTVIWQVLYTPIIILLSYYSYKILQIIKNKVLYKDKIKVILD